MSLSIAIETSSRDYFLALGAKGETVYDSASHEGLNKNKDLGLMLRTGLNETGFSIEEVEFISVNIGPGGLGAVRSGVSFANGLSFGLGKPILPLNSFELTGFEAAKNEDLPILITSNAADGHAYGGVYHGGKIVELKYGPLENISRELTSSFSRCALAGTHQNTLPDILASIECAPTGIKFAQALTQIDYIASHDLGSRLKNVPASPLNELSPIFACGEAKYD